MPDRQNRWDGYRHIYPKTAEMLDWAMGEHERISIVGSDSLFYCDSDRKLARPSCAEGPYLIPRP